MRYIFFLFALVCFHSCCYPLHARQALNPKSSLAPQFYQKVSLSITPKIPLHQVLLAVCQEVCIDLYMDPSIAPPLTFHASNIPIAELIQELCLVAGLRCEMKGRRLRIEKDIAYAKTYSLPYLNHARSSDNQVAIATNIFSADQPGQDTSNNGSLSKIISKGESDFWREVQENLETLLTTNQDSLSKLAIHRQGGLVTVTATQRQHHLIEDYFKTLKKTITKQVLIEAKVIEVSLKDEYKAGINWQLLTDKNIAFNLPFARYTQTSQIGSPLSGQQDMMSFGVRSGDFSALLQALQHFGLCKTLSSPRLTVLNNQTAILKVAQNQVYFRLHYDKHYNWQTERESITVRSDIQTLPIGLVMSVHPAIDSSTSKIVLALRPTISRLARTVSDPAVDIAHGMQGSADLKPSLIPVVEVREIDSILELESGMTIVLGGLMETRQADEQIKVPILGDIPGLGNLFTATTQSEEVVELVILLKATILD